MDLYHDYKDNGYFTSNLYHLLNKNAWGTDGTEEIIPSEYIKEMRMSTAERLMTLNSMLVDNIEPCAKGNQPVLSFTPRVLVFQNFKPNEKYVAKFLVKNISSVPVFLNMSYKESLYFSVKPVSGQVLLSRLAPGIGVSYNVTFLPTHHEDYVHKITFVTNTDHYVLPLIGMGPRPMFDFPDQISLPRVPLKVESSITIRIRNVGITPAGFTLLSKCPFSVYPKSAYLKPDEVIEIRVAFKTMYLGTMNGVLNVLFETGEKFRISVFAATHAVCVELDKHCLRFADTYNTMSRQLSFKITNKAAQPLTFMCMKNTCVSNDFEEKVKLATVFYNVKESESTKCRKLVQYDVISSDEHERVYTRIFYDEIQDLVADETLTFRNMNFTLTPISGTLWPEKPTELTVTFCPQAIGDFEASAYLDIDGVLERIHVKMVGTSLAPTIELNFETIDIDKVYINTPYHYEVPAKNKGYINGVIVYKPQQALFGSHITCTPERLCLKPDEEDLFVITFCNKNQGPFFEEVSYQIQDTNVVLKLYLKGEVIYPSVKFSRSCMDFGVVSLGVPTVEEVDVINESVIRVAASVNIPDDGPEISAISLKDYSVNDRPKPMIPTLPKEFTIDQTRFTIEPEAYVTLKITVLANLVRDRQITLEMELENSDSAPIVLPILVKPKVPEITPAPDIKLHFCFLDYPYYKDVSFKSDGVWGYYTIDEPEPESNLQISTDMREGYIEPNSTVTLQIEIKTSVLGKQDMPLRIHLFGKSEPIQICHITGCGIRPIVTCQPAALHFGNINVLTKAEKALTLSNDSPVNVNFRVALVKDDGKFQVHPPFGQLLPESESVILVSVYLIDALAFYNKVVIHLEDVKDIIVPLTVTGIGTSITIDGRQDKILVGRHFTKIPLNVKVEVVNHSTRFHVLEWSNMYKQNRSGKPLPPKFFTLEPSTLKMAAGEKTEMAVVGMSNKETFINELWYMTGNIEGINKKELLLECPIIAEFVDPKLEISSHSLEFHCDKGPYSESYKLTDIVTIKNVSRLPLTVEMSVKSPFSFILKKNYKILKEDEDMCCCIHYNKSDINVQNMLHEMGPHNSQTYIDYLTMEAIEPLREGSLQFFQDINKIKMAFSFTNLIEVSLEDEEVIKIQVIFDTAKHTSLKSRVYMDVIKIKFVGHKNKDTIKVVGRINFPNILVLTPKIDFECILNDTIQSKIIHIQNVTPLLVCYRFRWKKCTITTSALSQINLLEIKDVSLGPLSDIKSLMDTDHSEYGLQETIANQTPTESLTIDKIDKDQDYIDPEQTVFYEATQSDIQEPAETCEVKIMKKVTPLIKNDYSSFFKWVCKFPKKELCPKIFNFNDVMYVAPHRGTLKPNEKQFVHLVFNPPRDIDVKAVLEIEVLGGPTESVYAMAQSSDLRYKLSSQKVNFNIRSFHELAVEKIDIVNTSLAPFEYKVYLFNESMQKHDLEGHIVNVQPQNKIVHSREEVHIKLMAKPGVLGYFKKTILLELGYLPLMPIQIYGWGVIPQIYSPKQIRDTGSTVDLMGYSAIATLTSEYLEAVAEMLSKSTISEHMNTPLTEDCFDDPELRFEWHICSPWDGCPSIMDIELATERYLATEHFRRNPEIMSHFGNKIEPIPGFITTTCVIDLGVVIVGSTVHMDVAVVNYGPIPIKLEFEKYSSNMPRYLTLKLCGKLAPGETGKLDVTFSPNNEIFPKLKESYEKLFNIVVPYGATMPVSIRAICAVPYLVSAGTTVDIGTVKCGNKMICSIPLQNIGIATCVWFVTLRIRGPPLNPSPVTVLNTSGVYQPGERGWLSVSFKPLMEMVFEGSLVFRFHMNPSRLVIRLRAQGVAPAVHLIGPDISFPPTLPWSEPSNLYFALTNPCPFPIELIFPHSDTLWEEEDTAYNLLNRYYNKPGEMLLPALIPGYPLPIEIVSFCKTYKDLVEKHKHDEAIAEKASTPQSKPVSKLKGKSPKPGKTPLIVPSMTPPAEITSKKRIFRTDEEITADVLRSLRDDGVDPLKECLRRNKISSIQLQASNMKGIIIIFHGSPCEETEGQEIAHSTGKYLGLPTINVDTTIVKALCECDTSAKYHIVSSINEYFETGKHGSKSFLPNEGVSDDNFELMWSKIDYIARAKVVPTPRAKSSDKKKESPSVMSHNVPPLGVIFTTELVVELLRSFFEKLEYECGFIVESLSSVILRTPPNTLTTILQAKRTIWNIHLVLCHSDFNKWVREYDQRKNETKEEIIEDKNEYTEEEIKTIIEEVELMNAQEYQELPPQKLSIYIEHGLAARRNKYHTAIGLVSVPSSKHGRTPRQKDTTKTDDDKKKPGKTPKSPKTPKKEDLKAKQSPSYVFMNSKYNEYYKNTCEQLIHTANNWIIEDAEMGYPIFTFTGQVLGATEKKHITSEATCLDRGFPLTILTGNCLKHKETLVDMFRNSALVQEALMYETKECDLPDVVKKEEFTVLLKKSLPHLEHIEPLQWQFLDEKPIPKCECNQMTELSLLDDSTQDNILNILSKWHCVCGTRMTSTQTSTSEIPSESLDKSINRDDDSPKAIKTYPLPLQAVPSITDLEKRLVLEPGDLVRLKYLFKPEDEGNFSVKRYVEVRGWPESRITINATGICDLPRIDSRPKKMFKNFVRRIIEGNVYKKTFLDETKIFDFGPIFVGLRRIYEEDYSIELRNSSLMSANIKIGFTDDTHCYQIDKDFISLQPGCRDTVTMSAAPTTVSTHKNTLVFCIRDNPEVVSVPLTCSGVVPDVEILPLTKTIDYGKLLLYRRQDDRFIIKNDSVLPIMWKIRNPEEFKEDFIISNTSGIVLRNENQVVPVTYIACNVGIITHKMLLIDIYDEECRGDPFLQDKISLSAECYDVLVECAYENLAENFLNYGNVKVNSTHSQEMYLQNRGKYNIYYKLKKVKTFPEPSLLKSMEANAECGLIPPNLKMVCIEFKCTPSTSMNLVNVPAYTCCLLDGRKDQVVVAKFPICITIASFYNTFTLFPLGELNFHVIPVGTSVTREVILTNTSKCPITFRIDIPEKYLTPTADAEGQEPVPHISDKKKEKDTRIKHPALKCGNFLIASDDNLLPPASGRIINIQFTAPEAETYEETIKFVISDTCPPEQDGVPLRLVGVGALPTLDIWNVENTFREHLILKSISDYTITEPSPHCVFTEDTVTLHFFCVVLQSKHVATIDLFNSGLVPCVLLFKLHYQTNTDASIFALEKNETYIEPLSHRNLNIKFAPKALGEYRAVLDIKLKLMENEMTSYKICLVGTGNIPRVRMLMPSLKYSKVGSIQLPLTCLGSLSSRNIEFQNISDVRSLVELKIINQPTEERNIFWLTTMPESDYMVVLKNYEDEATKLKLTMNPDEKITVVVHYNPIRKGRAYCDIKFEVENNPYEYFTIVCEAEAFMEDVILTGLMMLPIELESETARGNTDSTNTTTTDSRKKSRSASPKKDKKGKDKKKKKLSQTDVSATTNCESTTLKYELDFGGCELHSAHRRTVIMVNNSEKVYKFNWMHAPYLIIKPCVGYISPGEEKDIEILFYSAEPVAIIRESMHCTLQAINDDTLTMDLKGATWDSRQSITVFHINPELNIMERREVILDEQMLNAESQLEPPSKVIHFVIFYAAETEYIKYECKLDDSIDMKDSFIYQKRAFDFNVVNKSKVPMKISWNFEIDEDFPARTDEIDKIPDYNEVEIEAEDGSKSILNKDDSKATLFSGTVERESVDTWMEHDLPFTIYPEKDCLKALETRTFQVTFAPTEAFLYKVRLRSHIDNLDPSCQNIMMKITAKSLVPYCHLDIPESDYLTSGRRKNSSVNLPLDTPVLEFNTLGSGCFKKTFNVVNPTDESYEFIFEAVLEDAIVPIHCNMLKGFVESGTSSVVTFTFAPIGPGVYESQWKFSIPIYSLVIPMLVIGTVREPRVVFVPRIVVIRNSLVGFQTTHEVALKNPETESLRFKISGNSLCDETGRNPVKVEPKEGILKPCSETKLRVSYTPLDDGPLSFKIFCSIQFLTKNIALCVNALSHCIRSNVTYSFTGCEHTLSSDAVTKMYLDQTASMYKRTVPFKIKNEGSATFMFEWRYTCSAVKKYLNVSVEPKLGHVVPGNTVDCTLTFALKTVPVQSFPLSLSISDGPEYNILLYSEIRKPMYRFSCKQIDFGKCIVNAPDTTYKKKIVIENEDTEPIHVHLKFDNVPELFIHYNRAPAVNPGERHKIYIYFRPKIVKEYEYKLQFSINTLSEEFVIIKGEGVPLLFDLFEGCQKSFDLGFVKVGQRIVKDIDVMNYSKVTINAEFMFRETIPEVPGEQSSADLTSVCLSPTATSNNAQYIEPGPSRGQMLQRYKNEKIKGHVEMDTQKAMSSLRVVPTTATIPPFEKFPLKIYFKPVGVMGTLDVQLHMLVLGYDRPVVRLRGFNTGMSMELTLSQSSMQFGRVRKRGCKTCKLQLINSGHYGAKFCWQPLPSDEFTITPWQGYSAAQTTVTFSISFRPKNQNPFVKLWACCMVENYRPLPLAIYASCIDLGNVQNATIAFEAPVRGVATEYVTIINPSDDLWVVATEVSGNAFETVKEFNVEPNSKFNVAVLFKPKTMGDHEGQVLFSPVGDSALIVSLIGSALPPEPNDSLQAKIAVKQRHVADLTVHDLTGVPQTYKVTTEVMRMTPSNFDALFEVKHTDTVKVWGHASANCRWTFVSYGECEMFFKVKFTEQTTEVYQYYNIHVKVFASDLMGVVRCEARARESVQIELNIENPLNTDAEFFVLSHSLACKDKIEVGRKSSAPLVLNYSPLVVGTIEEMLDVYNSVVGSYHYKMVLTCLPAKEKHIEYSTELGTAIPIRLKVQNMTTFKADFSSSVSHPSITTDKEYSLAGNEKGKFQVIFEPTELGVQKCRVSFNSPLAGEFVFNITGNGLYPKPRGPFEIKPGGSLLLRFKNVFEDVRMFKINVDRKEFYVKTQFEPVKPKKEMRVTVYLCESSELNLDEPPTGSLTIECYEPSEPKVEWTYFLRAIL